MKLSTFRNGYNHKPYGSLPSFTKKDFVICIEANWSISPIVQTDTNIEETSSLLLLVDLLRLGII
jgi:hypothetical protein